MKDRKFNIGGGSLDKAKSVVKTGLKFAVPIATLLSSTHAKAEELWVCGVDANVNPDGTTVANINDGSVLYGYVGHRDGTGVREKDIGSGAVAIEKTEDGFNTTDTDITSNIISVDSSITPAGFDTGAYDPETDRYVVYDFSNLAYWDIANVADSSKVSGVELLNGSGFPSSPGSIDKSTGAFVGTTYVDSTYRSDVASFSSSKSPSIVYSRTGYDSYPVADLANDRLFMDDSSYSGYRVDNVSGTPVRTSMGVSNFDPTFYDSALSSASGFDEVIYTDNSVFEVKYCYDANSGVTVSPDTDGDGINDDIDACVTENATGFDTDVDGCIDDVDGDSWKADVDCIDTNAAVYPGAPIVYGDDVDSNCDNTDGPTAPVISINPSTTVELMASVVLSAESSDDEDSTLTYTWTVENSTGTTVDSGSGERRSYTPTAEDTYTVTCVATDSDGIPSDVSTKTFTVEDTPVYSDLPVVDGPVTDGTYYDGADPEKGWIEVKGVSIEGDKIVLDEFGSSFAVDHYPAFEFSAPDAGVEGVTSDDLVGEDVMGFMAAKKDAYESSDTTDTTRMLKVTQTEGEQDIEGTFTNADGSLELDEHLKGAVSDVFADVQDDPDEVDTGDTGDSGDTGEETGDSGDTDTGGETASDTDTGETGDTHETGNTNDSNDSGNNVEDTNGNVTTPTTCSGCATTDGKNGTWALGLAGMALLARRRK